MKLKVNAVQIPVSVGINIGNGKTRYSFRAKGSDLIKGEIRLPNGDIHYLNSELFKDVEIDPDKWYDILAETQKE